NGVINSLTGTTLNVTGDLANSATITVNYNGGVGATVFSFASGALTGTGNVMLNGVGANAQLNGTLTQAAGHTISGWGQINAALTNNGTVNANINAGTLTLQSGNMTGNMTNNNLLEATGGGTLAISGITVTQGASGQISALGAGSKVNLAAGATISGGMLSTTSGGVIQNVSGVNTISSAA